MPPTKTFNSPDANWGHASLGQANAIGLRAACHVLERPFTTGRLQGIPLQIEVLVIGRYPSVAEQHGVKSN